MGFKANLTKVCGCPIQIVGRTRSDLLDNLRRHMDDVHSMVEIAQEVGRKLKAAAREI